MATGFEILIAGQTHEYARQAAAAGFRELERLESELSRFVETSDIARINRLRQGENALVGEDAMACLVAAMRVSESTARAFDPAYASARADNEQSLFVLNPASHEITSLTTTLRLDLGAVGKGYALDRMAAMLREWDITAACLQTGGSTVLALSAAEGSPGWPVSIGEITLNLSHRAVSASGTGVQGNHLLDPRSGEIAPRGGRVWSLADSAAEADALSTAFFVMGDAEIAAFCQRYRQYGAAVQRADGEVHWIAR